MRISVTIPDQVFKFVQHLHTKRGLSISAALCHAVITNPEFSAYEKDQARQAADAVKASTKTTVVIEAKPTREDMLAEEQERRRRIRDWPAPPVQENPTAFCEHGVMVTDEYGNSLFCADCAIAQGYEVCREHEEAKPCPYCSMDEVGEAAP